MILYAHSCVYEWRVWNRGKSHAMELPTKSVRERNRTRAGTRPRAARESSHGLTSAEFVYDLRGPDGSSDRYYDEIAAFSNRLLAEMDRRAGALIDAYAGFLHTILCEAPRSRGDYALEFLTLGLLRARYSKASEQSPRWAVSLARWLLKLRGRYPHARLLADWFRAPLTRFFLIPGINERRPSPSHPLARLPRLIAWLKATGEFTHEAARIENWRQFLRHLPVADSEKHLNTAMELGRWFEQEAQSALGTYTQGTTKFLAETYRHRGCREDQIFCGRSAVEYHLNMVAGEIMSRGLRRDFERQPRRIALVPTCMRSPEGKHCRARSTPKGMICTGCSPSCAVHQLTRKMKGLRAAVYLIPHATGFSRWLQIWQNETGQGVTAAACLLNIASGGLEMRARGIASQCIPLDFPGCRKHWSTKGCPTALNQDRLVQLAGLGEPSTAPQRGMPG